MREWSDFLLYTLCRRLRQSLTAHDIVCAFLFSPITERKYFMEAERINTIGNTLDDLRQRTGDLRRYL